MNKYNLNYISLFSSAGIGCYGFKKNNFKCLCTVEIDKKRIEIQKINNVCLEEDRYICDDIKKDSTKQMIFNAIGNENVNVLLATPPCQSMSTLNKKNANDLDRNSLIVETLELIKKILPDIFIIENVRTFLKSICQYNGELIEIENAILDSLENDYNIIYDVINFKDYGTNSSRPRTLVIGTRKDLLNFSPFLIWPDKKKGKTIKEAIGDFKSLNEFNEYDPKNPWHFFREYKPHMREWIKNIKENQSAFDSNTKPYKIVDGNKILLENKMTNKYKRLSYDSVAPCVHTRSDILASQWTIHPKDDRVLSVPELKRLMNIHDDFKFCPLSDREILKLENPLEYIKKYERLARTVIGEAVPQNIFSNIAIKIKELFKIDDEIKQINENTDFKKIKYIPSKIKWFELKNVNKIKNSAFYTPMSLSFNMVKKIWRIETKKTVLEPCVGHGAIFYHMYIANKNLKFILNDIDEKTINDLELIFDKKILKNVQKWNHDFLNCSLNSNLNIDYIITNPPFNGNSKYNEKIINSFYKKAFSICKNVFFILPKFFLNSSSYIESRKIIFENGISMIEDFGFNTTEALIEIISIISEKGSNKTKILGKDRCVFDKKYIFINDIFIIYRNMLFDNILSFGVENDFIFYRDRKLRKNDLKDDGKYWVIKSKNIINESVCHIKNYDKYIDENDCTKRIIKDINDFNYVIPNFTYNFRIAKKPKNVIGNGSVIFLKSSKRINLDYMNSNEYKEFFKILMNYSKFTLNLNANIIALLRIKEK